MNKTILIIGLFLIGFFLGKNNVHNTNNTSISTIEIRDTIYIDNPIVDTIYNTEYVETFLPSEKEYIYYTDTLVLKDTIKVYVPISDYVFKDSLYTINARGYNVSLNKVEVYPTTIYKTEHISSKNAPRYGIGIQVGYGIHNKQATPYIGIGVQYNLITF